MKRNEAKQAMKQFVTKYAGKAVLFRNLNDDEKFIYIMIKSFNYFKFLGTYDRLTRAIQNANAHKESNFEHFAMYNLNECMMITND